MRRGRESVEGKYGRGSMVPLSYVRLQLLLLVVRPLLVFQLAPLVMLRLAKLVVAGAVDGDAVGSRRLG